MAKAAPLPSNEVARLKELVSFKILDTPPEKMFDAITNTVATLFKVPICLVSLVDEKRQWFKSKFGLTVAETDRELAFCAYTILKQIPDAHFIVLDTLKDPRFCKSPLVLGAPFIRFYCGAPLITRNGLVLGSLCVIDVCPHEEVSLAQGDILTSFATQVVNLLQGPYELGEISATCNDFENFYTNEVLPRIKINDATQEQDSALQALEQRLKRRYQFVTDSTKLI